MTEPLRFRKRPIEVDALQWTGANVAELDDFAGRHFTALGEGAHCDDPAATAQVFDRLHMTWIPVQTGDWIVQGIHGEFYPCRDDVFTITYKRVEPDDD